MVPDCRDQPRFAGFEVQAQRACAHLWFVLRAKGLSIEGTRNEGTRKLNADI